jgi:hypothetical protein
MDKKAFSISWFKSWQLGLNELAIRSKEQSYTQKFSDVLESLEESFQYSLKNRVDKNYSGLIEMQAIFSRARK